MVADNSQSMSVSWSPYGKILQNNKARGANLTFGYNAMQQRVLKRVVLAGDTTRTYYIRDAQGNTMGVYTRHNDSVSWREQYIFGSSRLGLYRADTLVNKGLLTISKLYEGKRNYELTNHLGNVMAVINDRKADTTIGVNKGYNAVVISATDYFPFGMAIDSRSYTSALYRYGFNGKENDKETGEQDYGMRIYDPRIAKFLSIDPLTRKYPELTPYQFASNTPIVAIDIDGLEAGIETRMNGWDRARANGTKSAEQIEKEMQWTGIGGVIGAGLVFDAFFTKGYVTRGLIGLDLLNAISADHAAGNIKGDYERKDELKKEASDGYKSFLIGYGISKGVGVGLRLGVKSFSTVGSVAAKILSRQERLNLFITRLEKAEGVSSPRAALKLINNTLDEVEDAFSGVPKNPDAIKMPNINDGRMYGVLDDKYVKVAEDGSLIAKTRRNIITIDKDGGFKISERYGDKKIIIEKPAKTSN